MSTSELPVFVPEKDSENQNGLYPKTPQAKQRTVKGDHRSVV